MNRAIALALATALPFMAGLATGEENMAQQELEAETSAAFDAVRHGDAMQIAPLLVHGDALTPLLVPRVTDPDPAVRREALALLEAIGTTAAAIGALPALGDADPALADRAARTVYRAVLRSGPQPFPALDVALAALPADEPGASALLLLGFADNPQGLAMLQRNLGATRLVKIDDAGPTITAALPTALALSRRGDNVGRRRLETVIGTGSAAEHEFLLRNVAMIDDAGLLKALALAALGDQREIADGLPAGVTPRRRVADLAVETLIAAMKLPAGVKLDDTRRYDAAEIETVRGLIAGRLPN